MKLKTVVGLSVLMFATSFLHPASIAHATESIDIAGSESAQADAESEDIVTSILNTNAITLGTDEVYQLELTEDFKNTIEKEIQANGASSDDNSENEEENIFSWTSSNDKIATVDENGLIHAISSGTVIISISDDSGVIIDSCTVNVIVKINNIALDDQLLLLKTGQEKQLVASIVPLDAYDTKIYSYESSDEQIVTVSEDGLITAVSEGCATITVHAADDKTRECCVVVFPDGDLQALSQTTENWTYKQFYQTLDNLKNVESPWDKVICIGDSVTEGIQAGPSKSEWIPNYPMAMSHFLDADVINCGIGGSGIWSRSNLPLLNYTDRFEPADAVFIMAGYNDWFYGTQCPMGDTATEYTFTYDLNVFYDKIAEIYPDSDIFVILPPTPHAHSGYEPYYDFSWIRAVEHDLADSHNFYVINLPAEDILNGAEEDTWKTFFSDGVHLNDYGYTVLGTIITDKAIQIKENEQ